VCVIGRFRGRVSVCECVMGRFRGRVSVREEKIQFVQYKKPLCLWLSTFR